MTDEVRAEPEKSLLDGLELEHHFVKTFMKDSLCRFSTMWRTRPKTEQISSRG